MCDTENQGVYMFTPFPFSPNTKWSPRPKTKKGQFFKYIIQKAETENLIYFNAFDLQVIFKTI